MNTDKVREALEAARRTMRNVRGAVESNQIEDKDVRRQLTRGIEAIDAALSALAASETAAKTLTVSDLAEALSCFWNAALGEAHNKQDSTAFAVAGIMAEGISAVERRLREIASADVEPGVTEDAAFRCHACANEGVFNGRKCLACNGTGDASNGNQRDRSTIAANVNVNERGDEINRMADAIDAARYTHPQHPRERDRAFSEADKGDREYAFRLARAAWASINPAQELKP